MIWICPPEITAAIDRQLSWWERPIGLAASLVGGQPRRWCDLVWWLTCTPTARDRILQFVTAALLQEGSAASHPAPRPGLRHECPVCRVPLLAERGRAEICPVCWWEDDGIDEEDWSSGCNHGITLREARANFARTMFCYPPNDPQILSLGGGETDLVGRREAIVDLAVRIETMADGLELTTMAEELDRRVVALQEAWVAWMPTSRDAAGTAPSAGAA